MSLICRKNIKPVGVVLILMFVVSFILLTWIQFTEASDVVNIPDENLEEAIRDQLGKPTGDITAADMEELTSLFADNEGIEALTGLEYAINLVSIDLSGNQISDVSPLSDMTDLERLALSVNQISDISPLSDMTDLEWLYLDGNQISDISPLSDMTDLEWLHLSMNQISDISPLSGLTGLRRLFLHSNEISDLSPLSGLTNLRTLQLHSNDISDISPLSDLSNLENLTLSSNDISDISPLSDLINLDILLLSDNDISDISPLSELNNLQVLWLQGNEISDISPLSDLTELEELFLQDNYIDITEGSPTMEIINDFLDDGVDVTYEPQDDPPTEEPDPAEYDLTIAIEGKGTVEPEAGIHTHKYGKVVELKAIPAEGWEFSKWEGSVADSESAETTITIYGDREVTAIFTEVSEPEIKLGDITGNGRIDVGDAVLVMQCAIGLEALDSTQKKAADVNGDGIINIHDVVLIMQKALGLIDDFPKKALPAEIEEWIEYSRDIWLAQEREHDDTLYLLVTFGERPTEGYKVEITGVVEETDWLTVYVKFTEPGEDDPVAQVLTYPYDLKAIDPAGLPVEFVAKGDIEFVPRLQNLDWLPPMVAGSEDIRVLSPAPGDKVPREFEVQGIELVFEGTVQYRLLDGAGNELEKGIAEGGHGYNWGYFTVDLVVPEEIESGEELLVELFSESPKDGSVENLVELELLLR